MRQRGAPMYVRFGYGLEFIFKCLTRLLAIKGIACRRIAPGTHNAVTIDFRASAGSVAQDRARMEVR